MAIGRSPYVWKITDFQENSPYKDYFTYHNTVFVACQVIFEDDMNRFGKKLHTLRKQRGISQTELAASLSVQQSYVGKLERGERIPNVAMLRKIAELFGVSFDQLMNDEVELD